jgi:hypothetical protein
MEKLHGTHNPEADKKIYKKEASKYLSKVEMKKAFPPD